MTKSLRQGALLEICIDLYRHHRDNGAGGCLACATPVGACATRRNCDKVLLAAGLDPAKFNRAASFAW
ncbi:MAG: hypothetical protein V7603_1736 [Micromonosporaceae bacterium]